MNQIPASKSHQECGSYSCQEYEQDSCQEFKQEYGSDSCQEFILAKLLPWYACIEVTF